LWDIIAYLKNNLFSSLLVTYDGSSRQSTRGTEMDASGLVDVRIIDFAHSTHKGLRDSTLHVGPDEGFIFGIENFIAILEEIKSEKREQDWTKKSLSVKLPWISTSHWKSKVLRTTLARLPTLKDDQYFLC
jgi:hypothetical protein